MSKDVTLQSSDGTEIFASAAGNPSNPPIVFLHGYICTSLVFEGLFRDERLLSRYYLVSYDLRGHGSGKPTTEEGYASNLFADDFAAVIRHFNVKSPLFAGWSYGGTIATDIFSHLPPQTISGIFGITTFPSFELLVLNPIIASVLPLFNVNNDVTVNINTKAAFLDACFNDPSVLPTQVKWAWLGSAAMQFPPIPGLLVTRKQDTSKLFEAGQQGLPYLAINATADKTLLNDEIIKSLKPHFKNLEVHTMEGASHVPFIENKDEFVDVLISFADKVFANRIAGMLGTRKVLL